MKNVDGRWLMGSSSALLFVIKQDHLFESWGPEQLEKLWEEGKVAWPSITEEEIYDRSKGDYLSKGIVLVQLSWFIIQCIVRAAYGLAVTELEVATLAFTVLSGVTYYLWWHKPLDVRCPVRVHLLPANEFRVTRDTPYWDKGMLY